VVVVDVVVLVVTEVVLVVVAVVTVAIVAVVVVEVVEEELAVEVDVAPMRSIMVRYASVTVTIIFSVLCHSQFLPGKQFDWYSIK
jgi:hypothetical protein